MNESGKWILEDGFYLHVNTAENHLYALTHLVQLLKESENDTQLLIEMSKNLYDYYKSARHTNSLEGIEVRVSEVWFTIWEIKDANTGEVLAHSYF
ncbi:hypothetical protein [Bacillus phage BvP]